MPTSKKLTIEVWADAICPWCYMGEHRLAQAVEQSGHADQIDLRIRTYQLRPNWPDEVLPIAEYMARDKGMPAAEIAANELNVAGLAHAEGLVYAPDHAVSNTLDMLRLVHLASDHGLGWQMMRAFQTYVFSGGFDAFERDTIARLAQDAGLPVHEIDEVLAGDKYTDAVRADKAEAVDRGATFVPFTVLAGTDIVAGSSSVEIFADAIAQAWERFGA